MRGRVTKDRLGPRTDGLQGLLATLKCYKSFSHGVGAPRVVLSSAPSAAPEGAPAPSAFRSIGTDARNHSGRLSDRRTVLFTETRPPAILNQDGTSRSLSLSPTEEPAVAGVRCDDRALSAWFSGVPTLRGAHYEVPQIAMWSPGNGLLPAPSTAGCSAFGSVA